MSTLTRYLIRRAYAEIVGRILPGSATMIEASESGQGLTIAVTAGGGWPVVDIDQVRNIFAFDWAIYLFLISHFFRLRYEWYIFSPRSCAESFAARRRTPWKP